MASSCANPRSVGMASRAASASTWVNCAAIPTGGAGSASHGDRKLSSATAAWHCRSSACAQSSASPAGAVIGMSARPAVIREAIPAAALASLSSCDQAAISVAGGADAAVSSSFRNAAIDTVALPSAAIVRILKVSPRPSNNRVISIRSSASASRPARRVNRWPARLPLSTVEMYKGGSGRSVSVSYQL
ncbi:MAG: hypothetical protein CAPSK01_003329 [Candidatus Accumulibacter vicinus]|uniref:Uncharacterized protein n=1 Tax=Candidatus Accumulibacter vicinus TaxID=2954382 RepID=A0A084XXL8_9PROT|nr:MAG: hypothetical protein CAPSK01_003329 [Candidatus Accumulibacter vicinus]